MTDLIASTFSSFSEEGHADLWPTAARTDELTAIGTALKNNRSIVLVGAPGVGKSRLLRAALAGQVAGGTVAVATAAMVPDGVPGTSLNAWLDSHDADRVVVGVDDAHLLTGALAERVHYLAAYCGVAVIATVLADSTAPAGISSLWKDRVADRIEVTRFSEAGVGEVLRTRLGRHVDPGTVSRLHYLTGGNARLLSEVVDHDLEQGGLSIADDGAWRWSGLVGDNDRLVDLVWLQLGPLDPVETELVNMLALAGSLEADLPIVADLSAAAESLNHRGIVVTEMIGDVLHLRLAYRVYDTVLAGAMPELTARRLRLRLAEAIEDWHGHRHRDGRAELLRIRVTGDLASDRILAAARLSGARSDVLSSERFARLALQRSADGTAMVEATLLLSRALGEQGRFAEVERMLSAVWAIPVTPELRAELITERTTNLATRLDRVEDARSFVDDELTERPAASGARLHVLRAWIGILADELPAVAAEGSALLARESPGSALTQALAPAVAYACDFTGDTRKAVALLDSCRPAVENWAEPHRYAFDVAYTQVTQLSGGGEGAESLGRLRARPSNDEVGRIAVWGIVLRGHVHRLRGRMSEAIAEFHTARTFARTRDWYSGRSWVLAQLAGTLAESGQLPEASATIAEARSLYERHPLSGIERDGVDLESVVVLAHSGKQAQAIITAREVAKRSQDAGRLAQAILAVHLIARLGEAESVVDQAISLDAAVTTPFSHARAEHVRALASRSEDGLVRVAEEFLELGLLPLAAEAFAQASSLCRDTGHARKARAAGARFREILASYGGTVPPWSGCNRFRGGDPTLTYREREVAQLVAAGLTNRDVASRLVVSVRTVENHLQRAYHKLGIATRSELARSMELPLSSPAS